MENAISVKNLTKKFGDFTAVDNISFDIPRGKIFGFFSSNGFFCVDSFLLSLEFITVIPIFILLSYYFSYADTNKNQYK
jgi:ABC-type uncharacterized transport system ATPase subunit